MGKKERRKKGTFVPPTAVEVDEYAKSIGYDKPNLGRDFCQHYQETGWCIKGGKKMSSWKRTVRTWQQIDERNPCRANTQSRAAETVAPVVRDADGLTPRERVLRGGHND